MDLEKTKVLLASNSPRRRELLGLIVPGFGMAKMHDIDETYPADLEVHKIPEFLSRLKAEAYKHQLVDDEVIITADTIVINDGKMLGKPHDVAQAVEMLKALSGHPHLVTTGVTISSLDKNETFSVTTEVEFGDISDEEISYYVERYRPMDKAGAYGIQEFIGCIGIKGINGCFYNVMGLPLHELYQHLKRF